MLTVKKGYLNRTVLLLILVIVKVLFVSCTPLHTDDVDELTFQKELGRYLFFEKRLSVNSTKSCASCHNPSLAFSDGYRKAPGVFADLHPRNTPSLVNVSYQRFFNWANPDITSIEDQMNLPLFGTHPIEMGLDSNQTEILQELLLDSRYKELYQKAFPTGNGIFTWEQVRRSLSQYVSTINSFNAPYDYYRAGNYGAISESAKEGEKLFFSTKLQCFQCHKPPLFGADSSMLLQDQFVNIGLYDYTLHKDLDSGLHLMTQKEEDRGKFKIPSLRNLSMTAPYFHDGSGNSLEEVLQVYIEGGRKIDYGHFQGDGRQSPNKHPLIKGFTLTQQEKQQLIDFLESLNDSTIYTNPTFKSPF